METDRKELKKMFNDVSQQKAETKEILPPRFSLLLAPSGVGKTELVKKLADSLDAESENRRSLLSSVIIIDEKDKLDPATTRKFLDLMQAGFTLPEEIERTLADRAEAEKTAVLQAEADEAARIACVTSPALQSDMPVRPPLQFRPRK